MAAVSWLLRFAAENYANAFRTLGAPARSTSENNAEFPVRIEPDISLPVGTYPTTRILTQVYLPVYISGQDISLAQSCTGTDLSATTKDSISAL